MVNAVTCQNAGDGHGNNQPQYHKTTPLGRQNCRQNHTQNAGSNHEIAANALALLPAAVAGCAPFGTQTKHTVPLSLGHDVAQRNKGSSQQNHNALGRQISQITACVLGINSLPHETDPYAIEHDQNQIVHDRHNPLVHIPALLPLKTGQPGHEYAITQIHTGHDQEFILTAPAVYFTPDIVMCRNLVRCQSQEHTCQYKSQQDQDNGPFVCFFHFESSLSS